MPARKSHESLRKGASTRKKKGTARKSGGTRGGKRAKARKAQHTPAKVLIVNMIPKSLSGEDHQDSEPSIAVNPSNPLQIAASAFTPDPSEGPRAPIYVSIDGGNTWTLKSIVPSTVADGSVTGDITVAFGTSSNFLYAGIIRFPFPGERTRLNILRTKDFQSAEMMKVLVDRMGKGVDQPYIAAATFGAGSGKKKDRVYVGDNDFNATGGRTATIDQTLNGADTKPGFTTTRIESRPPSSQDGPPIRPAIHADGTVYGVFQSWRSFNNSSGEGTADVVVVRDDKGGASPNPFTDLVDPSDHKSGIRVVRGAKFNFNGVLGLQRTGGDVGIALDPKNSDIVYVAYNDDQPEGVYALHVLRSTDRGQTWSPELKRVNNAMIPAMAINTDGKLGLLYQQLAGDGASQQWITKFETTMNGTSWSALVLAQVPANRPPKQFDPYLGDYEHLMAVGKDFYGIFSANNTPKKTNFPNDVVYQRNVNWEANTLLDIDNITPVGISIDPFFFRVAG
jgi:hypothetical protein